MTVTYLAVAAIYDAIYKIRDLFKKSALTRMPRLSQTGSCSMEKFGLPERITGWLDKK
jgi:hypothetical protein